MGSLGLGTRPYFLVSCILQNRMVLQRPFELGLTGFKPTTVARRALFVCLSVCVPTYLVFILIWILMPVGMYWSVLEGVVVTKQ